MAERQCVTHTRTPILLALLSALSGVALPANDRCHGPALAIWDLSQSLGPPAKTLTHQKSGVDGGGGAVAVAAATAGSLVSSGRLIKSDGRLTRSGNGRLIRMIGRELHRLVIRHGLGAGQDGVELGVVKQARLPFIAAISA